MSAVGELLEFVTTADNWWGPRGINARTLSHVKISVAGTAAAAALALPPAVWLGHRRKAGALAVALVNAGRAIPSFALVILLFPLSLRFGFGLGFWPTLVALVVLAVPPIFTNAYVGITGVDRAALDAARGMGMSEGEVLRRIELPIAVPLVVAGLRLAAVQVVATATLGAWVGFGGLGSYIFAGSAKGREGYGELLTGALLVALLAILTELLFGSLQRVLTPWNSRKATT